MKKLLLTLSLLVAFVVGAQAQEKLYLMGRNPYYGTTWEPSADDQYLTLTSEGVYEGEVSLKKNDGFMFYVLGSGDEFTTYAPANMSMVQFNNVDIYNATMEKDGNSVWLLSKFNPETLQEGDVKMSVDLSTLKGTFEQANVEEEVITNMYVWGSSNWGLNYSIVTEMTQDAANKNLYTATINVPEVGNYDGDSEYAPGADDPRNGYYMVLSPSGSDLFKSTRFTAPLEQKVVTIENDETFDLTLIKNLGGPMIFLSYGEITITFNVETYKFTAVYADGTGSDGPSSSVSAIETSGDVNVYDLTGKQVYSGSAEGVKNINKGIYIVNGKKVVVK